jgi:TfoX/Sxy family transcriptional regulator of competence genes
VAYDEALAVRIRECVAAEPNLREQRMFGGLAFLINGNMAVAASGQGGLLLRVDPKDATRLAGGSGVEPMVMRGRAMVGWLRVDTSVLGGRRDLERWVAHGVKHAKSLPPKPS